MRKVASRLLALAVLLTGTAVLAQDKKPIPMKKEKEPAAKEKAVTGVVEIYEKNDKFRYKVIANGKTLVYSVAGYASHEEAAEALEELKHILHTSKVTEAEGKGGDAKKGTDKKKAKEKETEKMDTK